MNCPRCGKSVPSGAAFCLHCGQSLAPQPVPVAAAPAVGLGQAFAVQRKRNQAIAAAAGIITLLLGTFIGLRAAGVLKIGAEQAPGSNLRASGSIPTASLERGASIAPPVFEKPAQAVVMPDDVEAWLKHLEETERRKRILTARQTQDLQALQSVMGLGVTSAQDVRDVTDPDKVMDKTPANNKLQETIAQMKPQWYQLSEFFLSKPPPAECQVIAQNYNVGLEQMGDTMADIGGIVDSLNPMSPDLNKDVDAKKKDVYEIQQGHRQTIDESFKKALFGVDEVCGRYHRKRWFDIDTSGGGSDILGKYMGG